MASHLRVKDVMTSEPITATPRTPFKELVDLVVRHDIGALPVVDDRGELQGIVTETDLLAKPAFGQDPPRIRTKVRTLLSGNQRWRRKASGLMAAEVMTSPVLTIQSKDPLALASRRLVENRIGRLPVVDEGHLVGIVSRRDLLRPFDRPDEDIKTDVGETLNSPLALEHARAVTFSIRDGRVTLTGIVDFPHDVTFLHDVVASVAGVVEVDNRVTARLPEPTLEEPRLPREGATP